MRNPRLESKGWWNPPPLWEGGTAFIIGGGPSVDRTDLSLIKDKHVIGCNQAYTLGDWIDFLFFGDSQFWDWHGKQIKAVFPGIVVTNHRGFLKHPDKMRVMQRSSKGVDMRPYWCAWNKSTGAAAINFACKLGAKKIVLIGFDMRRVKNRNNFHAYPRRAKQPPISVFNKHIPAIQDMTSSLRRMKIEVINATPGSALDCFPIKPLEEAL